MNELQTQSRQLPDTLTDLSKFVLVGREKLNAVRAEIRAIQKVGLAKEVHEQKLAEAQEIAEAVLDAEAKLGELTSKLNTMQGQRKDLQHIPNSGAKSKKEQLKDLGITHEERFESLAKHPEVVEQAKADARAEGRIVTRADVLNRISPPKTMKQSIREFMKQAREEHEEFQQTRQESVVDFEDIQKDKQNQEIINIDNHTTIQKAIASVNALILITDEELDEMVGYMKEMEKVSFQNTIRNAIKTLIHISNKVGD